ncbi:DUF3857 domain-containing protein, partial [Candidatus Eisenbacteria bacterium]
MPQQHASRSNVHATFRSWTSAGLLRALILLPALLLLIPAGSNAQLRYEDWLPMADDVWEIRGIEGEETEHAVILFSGCIIHDRSREVEYSEVSFYSRIRLLDRAGIDQLGTLEIPYRSETEFKHIRARTVKPDGRTIEVDGDEIYDKVLWSIGRHERYAKTLAFKGLEPGDIIECYYFVEVPFGRVPFVQFQHRYPTIEARTVWHFWTSTLLNSWERSQLWQDLPAPGWVITNTGDLEGTVEQLPNEEEPERLSLVYRNVPSLPDVGYAPPPMHVAARFFGYYSRPNRDKETPFWERVARLVGNRTCEFLEDDSRLADWMAPLLRRKRDL